MSTITLSGTGLASTVARKPRLRLTARGRAVLLAVIAIPVAGVIAAAALNGGAATATLEAGEPVSVIAVPSGESLWSIAELLAPEADPREVIDDIVRFNRLPSADVQAGQALAIPPQYSR